jgi:hypothetical protein
LSPVASKLTVTFLPTSLGHRLAWYWNTASCAGELTVPVPNPAM